MSATARSVMNQITARVDLPRSRRAQIEFPAKLIRTERNKATVAICSFRAPFGKYGSSRVRRDLTEKKQSRLMNYHIFLECYLDPDPWTIKTENMVLLVLTSQDGRSNGLVLAQRALCQSQNRKR